MTINVHSKRWSFEFKLKAQKSTMTKSNNQLPTVGRTMEITSKNYDRVYGLLQSIKVHINRISSKPTPEIQDSHFSEFMRIEMPRKGKHCSSDNSGKYQFKSYCPFVFIHLRKFFGITNEDFLSSLTIKKMPLEIESINQNHPIVFSSWDGRYLLTAITEEELTVLFDILPKYFQYVTTHPDTLISQFYGVYRIKTPTNGTVHFIVLNNVFPTSYRLYYKFELKGSTVGRSVPPDKKGKPGVTMKDTEFSGRQYLAIGPHDWSLLRTQFLDDTNFLSSCGLVDYSLLIGIHRFSPRSPVLNPSPGEKIEILNIFTPNEIENESETDNESFSILTNSITDRNKLLSFCGGLRATNLKNEPLSQIYFIGFVDFLQTFNSRKKAEHTFKSIMYTDDQISTIPPDKYATRIFNYLMKTIGSRVTLSREQELMILKKRERLNEMLRPITNQNSNDLSQPIKQKQNTKKKPIIKRQIRNKKKPKIIRQVKSVKKKTPRKKIIKNNNSNSNASYDFLSSSFLKDVQRLPEPLKSQERFIFFDSSNDEMSDSMKFNENERLTLDYDEYNENSYYSDSSLNQANYVLNYPSGYPSYSPAYSNYSMNYSLNNSNYSQSYSNHPQSYSNYSQSYSNHIQIHSKYSHSHSNYSQSYSNDSLDHSSDSQSHSNNSLDHSSDSQSYSSNSLKHSSDSQSHSYNSLKHSSDSQSSSSKSSDSQSSSSKSSDSQSSSSKSSSSSSYSNSSESEYESSSSESSE